MAFRCPLGNRPDMMHCFTILLNHLTRFYFHFMTRLTAYFFLLFLILPLFSAHALERTIGPSGEAVPRFASLKSDLVNVRRGPGRNHKILWVFKKLGLPVKIVSEYEEWREIEDQTGAKGWVFHSLLSRRRTGVTLNPKDQGLKYFSLLESSSKNSKSLAKIGKGVIVHIITCTGDWCHVAVNKKIKGWLNQDHLWGLFQQEPIKK